MSRMRVVVAGEGFNGWSLARFVGVYVLAVVVDDLREHPRMHIATIPLNVALTLPVQASRFDMAPSTDDISPTLRVSQGGSVYVAK